MLSHGHISTTLLVVIIILGLWEAVWKSLALWRSARRNEPVWFIVILILNTVGILPIVYLLLTRRRSQPST